MPIGENIEWYVAPCWVGERSVNVVPWQTSPRGRATRRTKSLVLVVDDERDIADSIADVLRAHHYDVKVASNGLDAVACAQSDRPGLVLLDWRMPSEPSGAELVRQLRSGDAEIPLVVLSADHKSLAEAMAAEVSDYLPKPFDVGDLLFHVNNLCA